MSDVKWIKIVTDIFDDEKILLIEAMPEADSIIVIWFKLLCLAGKQNNSGVFIMNGAIPYTDKMLATIFRRKESTVQMALQVFEQFGMVEIIDGVITIPNWNKHQSLDAMERRKASDREYQRRKREEQKALAASSSTDASADNRQTVDRQSTDASTDIGVLDKKENRLDITLPKGNVCRTSDVRRIIESWNSLGLSQIVKIAPESKRATMLRSRVKEYGVDGILQAIQKVAESDFLKGQNNRSWVITFDWFLKPNNFPKVLEGNFDNRAAQNQADNKPKVDYRTDFDTKWEGFED